MSVTGIRALLEAAEFLKKEEIAQKKSISENYQSNTSSESKFLNFICKDFLEVYKTFIMVFEIK